jgi:hypothetical protein
VLVNSPSYHGLNLKNPSGDLQTARQSTPIFLPIISLDDNISLR